METTTILFGLALIFGLYMAWSIGANDAANALGTSVGSGALTLRNAVILGGILEFSGAFLVGSHVSETVQKGIVVADVFTNSPMEMVYGMCAALLTAGAWLQVASHFGWPVSTTHSIVGSLVGFGLVAGGYHAIYWDKLGYIALSWVVSPLLSGVLSYSIFSLIRNKIFFSSSPIKEAKKLTPILVFVVSLILFLVLLFKGLKNLNLSLSLSTSLVASAGISLILSALTYLYIRNKEWGESPYRAKNVKNHWALYSLQRTVKHLYRLKSSSKGELYNKSSSMLKEAEELQNSVQREVIDIEDKHSEHAVIEKLFSFLQILSACLMAFAHGANDVANAIGPLAAILDVLENGSVSATAYVPTWILACGGVGIVIGLATYGWKVIETIGKKITELTPTRGFAAELGAASTILFASKLGLPISSTHSLVGAVLGVGFARGIRAINLTVVKNIVFAWLITIPVGASTTIIFYYLLRTIFN
ncbi:Putative phosphate permease CPn_0680/CP_0067/CPj0680/CpB0707 [Chlamydiales bacterium SCGC AB-751-O23]|jgi:inorganic phosphate transporter, PiT family|nr:Putative phosphate permease CPn_0680/CP_0067/CPj0680/CpB0707 [Chlamydiales bacterium SCGC AB-751-O23]